MAYDDGHVHAGDGPTCLIAILAPFLVVCAIVGYATLDGGGITQRDEQTGTVQMLTWHGWAPAGEPARQLSAPPAPAFGAANPTTAPLPTSLPAPSAVLVAPTVGDVAFAPAAGAGSGSTSQYAEYRTVEPAPVAPAVAAGLSPWTVLGWLLVGLMPLVLLTGTALVVHQYLTAIRRRPGPGGAGPVPLAETLPAPLTGAAAAGPNQSVSDPPAENAPPAVLGGTYIADFLRAERRPEMVAVGGTHDAPVAG